MEGEASLSGSKGHSSAFETWASDRSIYLFIRSKFWAQAECSGRRMNVTKDPQRLKRAAPRICSAPCVCSEAGARPGLTGVQVHLTSGGQGCPCVIVLPQGLLAAQHEASQVKL